MRNMKAVSIFLLTVLAIGGLTLFMGWLTSFLWNAAIVPEGGQPMDAIRGTALYVLTSLLFGNSWSTKKDSK